MTPSITKVLLRQYKSVEACSLSLEPLSILVGRNGVGKSNIIDALAFVADALSNTLEYAVRKRGGIGQVRRKSASKPTIPKIGVEVSLPDGGKASYSFSIAPVREPVFRVDHERCVVIPAAGVKHEFESRDGDVTRWSPQSPRPAAAPDRLLLVAASGQPEFRPVYDVLTRMVFHNLNPEAMKREQRPEPGALLAHDGRNLASVIKQLEVSAPAKLERVLQYIGAIGVPIREVRHKQAGSLETIEVVQDRGDKRPMTFEALALSDGTIRALGILVSLVSIGPENRPGPSLIGIEEPETALHPAAAGALMDALIEGSRSTQLLVTCHSPDLLEHNAITASMIRPVVNEAGATRVGTLEPAKVELLTKHLSTAGELLRLDQLAPDRDELERMEQESLPGVEW